MDKRQVFILDIFDFVLFVFVFIQQFFFVFLPQLFKNFHIGGIHSLHNLTHIRKVHIEQSMHKLLCPLTHIRMLIFEGEPYDFLKNELDDIDIYIRNDILPLCSRR